MHSDKLTVTDVETADNIVNTSYTCSVEVELAGDSIWDCDLKQLTVTDITVSEGVAGTDMEGYKHIGVAYTVDGSDFVEGSWRMYTDTGFENAISELLGFDVTFTEQGMQDDNYASME